MNSERIERRLTDRLRESWIGVLVDRGAPEHTREAAELMATHRRAEGLARSLAWERAVALATRPFRRNRTQS